LKIVPLQLITLRGFEPVDENDLVRGTLSEIRNPDKGDFPRRFTEASSFIDTFDATPYNQSERNSGWSVFEINPQ